MLTIPPRILTHAATVHVPDGLDVDHRPTGETVYSVTRCCIQRESKTARKRDNTPVLLNATMYIDRRLTLPRLDWMEVKRRVDAVGGFMTVDYAGESFEVATVSECLDDRGGVHHYEMGLM